MELIDQIAELGKNEEFVTQIKCVQSAEEFADVLKKHGIEAMPSQIEEMLRSINDNEEIGELDESVLENVSGGKKSWFERLVEGLLKRIFTIANR